MPFRYSCFISYRAGNRQRDNRYIFEVTEGLRDDLSAELELLLEEDVSSVYLDRSRLQGGDFFDRQMQQALCESVCMIVLFTPTYFSTNYTYCAREFKAMLTLETDRFRHLGTKSNPRRGLIIPIVLRREDRLPRSIREKRQYYDFEEFLQNEKRIRKPRKYYEDVRQIADYVFERYHDLTAKPGDPCAECDEFRFPTHKQVLPWVRRLMPGARRADRSQRKRAEAE